jgi:hypothetical protein
MLHKMDIIVRSRKYREFWVQIDALLLNLSSQ